MRITKTKFITHLPFVLLLAGSIFASVAAVAQSSQSDATLQSEIINKALNKSKLKNIHVSLNDGVATLTGTVEVFDLKEEADRRVHRIKGVQAVRNNIEVAGPQIPDGELEQKLVKAISYDRVGYGTTPFNAIAVNVQNGAVTLTGHAYGPVDADSAAAVAANTPGVKDVINEIQVDPLSPMDDRIRLQVFRSIYGFPSLNKYAMDPAKPIRISVQNGNVTLYGVVDNKADKDAANIRANSVFGVFKVTNDLQVAGSTNKD
ncbi:MULTISPECIES: BON domain-containing protein [Acidobacteriaceae]|uniref:BON domain-containing protein n=1 Tax=Acidobacteriaceae TaxID=204434 RepID=UPI00131D4AAF|nr:MULTISPECIES: BON domain-containing protein [Acidobacteriaceae]MDW5266850.1 BON domain-containing protein [Edaphobacter sp.]